MSTQLARWATVALLVPVAWYATTEIMEARQRSSVAQQHLEGARAAIAAGDYRRAEVAVGTALQLLPADVELQRESMRVAVALAADDIQRATGAQAGQLRYALDVLDAPDDPLHLVARGHLALGEGDAGGALKLYQQAAAVAAGSSRPHLAAARLHAREGRLLQAVAEFEAAAKAEPTQLQALGPLSTLYLELKRPADALAVAERALAVRDTAELRGRAAECLLALDRAPEAIIHLQTATTAHPADAESWAQLGRAHFLAEQPNEAEGALLRAFELDPTPAYRMALGSFYQARTRFAEAVPVFAGLLKTDPAHVGALAGLAQSLEGLGQPAEAGRVWERFITQAATDPALREQVEQATARLSALRKQDAPPAPPAPAAP
ncbi:MAG: tetratricopeptide repeat protein [Myxococcota bacterium]